MITAKLHLITDDAMKIETKSQRMIISCLADPHLM